MLLVTLRFKHYSPKDSEEGIVGYLIADTIGEVMQYVNKNLNGGRYAARLDAYLGGDE